ncbi:MAG: hypothetical protein IKM31_05365 [Oscillospiraceae bacterium]|nr:hypothetical protein [Oscillospiraceae bacterium]
MEKQEKKPLIKLHNSIREISLHVWRTLLLCGVACAVIVMATSSMMTQNRVALLVIGLVCVIFTGIVIYANTWAYGDRDANFVQFGRTKRDVFKGLKVGLIAIIPSLLMNIPVALSKLEIIPFDFMPCYRVLMAPLWPLINFIHPYGAVPHPAVEATELTEAMAATEAITWGQLGIMALLPLIFVGFCWAGYELGYHRISLGFKLMYEDKKKTEKKK